MVVALLRDMINWCIEHPVRCKRLADDDPKMKALKAYILAQRKGVALNVWPPLALSSRPVRSSSERSVASE